MLLLLLFPSQRGRCSLTSLSLMMLQKTPTCFFSRVPKFPLHVLASNTHCDQEKNAPEKTPKFCFTVYLKRS